MKNILAFVFGGLFSVGLMLSGMSNPIKVVGFLDVFGNWDPSLAFVMFGAIAVAFIPFQKAIRKPVTIFNEVIELPQKTQLDRNLVLGAFIFGVGWGIAGICPAPALTLIGLGYAQALYFVIAMLLGILIQRKFTTFSLLSKT
ncbi:DUF6691 family protein [uncultured Acinetobacter sp.]|uniref:DUF6691 family protein n=1 Tax=uncultured Acinetobacter sp. TaxID=165433 RepID=UPI0025D123C2|nr:DUF6691 family protein [uncultured Acinetobacter sp.]